MLRVRYTQVQNPRTRYREIVVLLGKQVCIEAGTAGVKLADQRTA